MQTLPYKTQAYIYAGIFLLLAIICGITYFIGRKIYKKHPKVSIALFVISILSLLGAGIEGINFTHAINIAKEVVAPPSKTNTRSNYFEIIGSEKDYNDEGYDFKTDSKGTYVLALEGLREGKIKLLTGDNDSFLQEFQTINVEPHEITHVILHIKPTQTRMHLVLQDPAKSIDVINIYNNSKAYRALTAQKNRLLPGQRANSTFIQKKGSMYVNRYNPAIQYQIKNDRITELEYYSNNILLDPQDTVFCLQNITGTKKLEFTKRKLSTSSYQISFSNDFNFYNKATKKWYNVSYVKEKNGKLKKFIVKSGINNNFD